MTPSTVAASAQTERLADLDYAHLWHPFTPMTQWRSQPPLIIERGEGPFLIDTEGNRYIDGVSSLWCNVHGHRVKAIDQAICRQLEKIAHSTLLGLASPPSIELAARLCQIAPGRLNKVFYSDAGATALEVAVKMAVGSFHHRGQPAKNKLIAFRGAYHGDTTGAMSVGYSNLFHRPFRSMVFETFWAPAADPCRPPESLAAKRPKLSSTWPSEDPQWGECLRDHCLCQLEALLEQHAKVTAAVVIEPLVQGAAGMICQPPGFLRGVADLAASHDVLLIADEVATGFGRTGAMFACEHEQIEPDILALAKGLSGGYLPLAATLATDSIEQAFCGEPTENRTFFHGHTYTGNALGCAAALASLDLFEQCHLLEHVRKSAAIISESLAALHENPHVLDIRQRGLMVGIELCRSRAAYQLFDPARRVGAALCAAMRPKGLIIRPLGDVLILMPSCAMPHDILNKMLQIVVETLEENPEIRKA